MDNLGKNTHTHTHTGFPCFLGTFIIILHCTNQGSEQVLGKKKKKQKRKIFYLERTKAKNEIKFKHFKKRHNYLELPLLPHNVKYLFISIWVPHNVPHKAGVIHTLIACFVKNSFDLKYLKYFSFKRFKNIHTISDSLLLL